MVLVVIPSGPDNLTLLWVTWRAVDCMGDIMRNRFVGVNSSRGPRVFMNSNKNAASHHSREAAFNVREAKLVLAKVKTLPNALEDQRHAF